MNRKKPDFDYKICMACGICMHVCNFGAIDLSKLGVDKYNKAYPCIENLASCTGCGICEKQCPVEAIVMN